VWDDDYINGVQQTDLIPLENIAAGNVPIAMIVAESDHLADPEDAEITRDALGDACVHYQTIQGGHGTFVFGYDGSWMTDDVIALLNQYHPISNSFLG